MDLNVLMQQIESKKRLLEERLKNLEKEQEDLKRMEELAAELTAMAHTMFAPKLRSVAAPVVGSGSVATAAIKVLGRGTVSPVTAARPLTAVRKTLVPVAKPLSGGGVVNSTTDGMSAEQRAAYVEAIRENRRKFREVMWKYPMQPMGTTEISTKTGIKMGTISGYLKEKYGIFKNEEGMWYYDPNRDPSRKPILDFGNEKKAV